MAMCALETSRLSSPIQPWAPHSQPVARLGSVVLEEAINFPLENNWPEDAQNRALPPPPPPPTSSLPPFRWLGSRDQPSHPCPCPLNSSALGFMGFAVYLLRTWNWEAGCFFSPGVCSRARPQRATHLLSFLGYRVGHLPQGFGRGSHDLLEERVAENEKEEQKEQRKEEERRESQEIARDQEKAV